MSTSPPGPRGGPQNTHIDEHIDEQLDEAHRLLGGVKGDSQANRLVQSTVEQLTLTNESLEQDLGQLSRAVKDAQLQKETELLTREIRICEAETELAKVKLSYAECADTASKNEELKDAVEELIKCHAEVRSQLAVCEKELGFKTSELDLAEANTAKLQRHLDETTSLCEVLKESLTYSDNLARSFEELSKQTEADMITLKTENAELWNVLQDALQTLKEERKVMSRELESVTREKEEIERRLNEMIPQLLPTWSREREERQLNKRIPEYLGILASTALRDERTAREDLERLLQESILAVVGSHDVEKATSLSQKLITIADIRRSMDMSVHLTQHLVIDRVSSWVVTASTNVLALKKDRKEIIWCYQTVKDLGDLMIWLSEFLNWNHEVHSDDISNPEATLNVSETAEGLSFTKLIRDSVNQLKLITECAVASQLSTACSTRSIVTLSNIICAYLGDQNYICRWSRDSDEVSIPAIAVVMQVLRVLVGFLVLLTEDLIPENAQKIFIERMQTVTHHAIKALKDRWMDAATLDLTSSHGTVTLHASFFQQTRQTQPRYYQEVIQLCATTETLGKLKDAREVWSLPNIGCPAEKQGLTTGNLTEPTVVLLFDSFEQITTRLDEASLLKRICYATRIIETGGSQTELIRKNDRNSDATVQGKIDESMSGESGRHSAALQRELTLMKSKLELYQLREEDFSKASMTNATLVQELQKKNETISLLRTSEISLRSLLDEKQKKLQEAETALEESEHMKRLISRLPPDLSAFELAKTRAVIRNMQRMILDESTTHVKASWAKIEHTLEKREARPSNDRTDVAEYLRIRESLVSIALQNPALTALQQNNMKDLQVQDILAVQAENSSRKFAVTQELCRFEAARGRPAVNTRTANFTDSTTPELVLVAKVPNTRSHCSSSKVVMDLSETNRWLEQIIF